MTRTTEISLEGGAGDGEHAAVPQCRGFAVRQVAAVDRHFDVVVGRQRRLEPDKWPVYSLLELKKETLTPRSRIDIIYSS